MRIRLAVEDLEPNHWIAWALDHPACFSSATTAADAVAQAPQKIAEYFSWLTNHDNLLPAVDGSIETQVVETFNSFLCSEDPEYIVNAFFQDDRRPLGYWDIETALRLLTWTRQDLLELIQSAPQAQLSKAIAGEVRGSIDGILKHIAGAENWYFWHLGLGVDQPQLSADPVEMLTEVRCNTHQRLMMLAGDEQVTKCCDELWSARKVVRRTLWHERDHTQQIAQLLAGM